MALNFIERRQMLYALILILCCQLAGEIASRATGIPLPGPVIGMAMMLGLLVSSERIRALIRPTGQGILGHMSLMFVPAGVGVVGHLAILSGQAGALAAALIGSTVLAIVVGALTFAWVARLTSPATAEDQKALAPKAGRQNHV